MVRSCFYAIQNWKSCQRKPKVLQIFFAFKRKDTWVEEQFLQDWQKSMSPTTINVLSYTGIAYVLRLLNQWQAFDSLHWFDTVRAKYMEEREKVVKQSREPGSDQKLQQSLALTLKRLDTYQKVNRKFYVNVFRLTFLTMFLSGVRAALFWAVVGKNFFPIGFEWKRRRRGRGGNWKEFNHFQQNKPELSRMKIEINANSLIS